MSRTSLPSFRSRILRKFPQTDVRVAPTPSWPGPKFIWPRENPTLFFFGSRKNYKDVNDNVSQYCDRSLVGASYWCITNLLTFQGPQERPPHTHDHSPCSLLLFYFILRLKVNISPFSFDFQFHDSTLFALSLTTYYHSFFSPLVIASVVIDTPVVLVGHAHNICHRALTASSTDCACTRLTLLVSTYDKNWDLLCSQGKRIIQQCRQCLWTQQATSKSNENESCALN